MNNKRKESDKERILSLCKNKDVDYGLMQPPMDAQVAINELCRYLLGEDYYVVNPVNSEQRNTQIVYDIECTYKQSKGWWN